MDPRPFIVGLILWVVYVAISEWRWHYKIKKIREYYRLTGGKRQIDENDPEWRYFLANGRLPSIPESK